ncbi:MAG: hypothetical protein CL610_22985 [Anaerolineaceae bacterium]|nr:hypothetical protein [Anaerolineaceae bacterium]
MYEQATVQLRTLATSDRVTEVAQYRAICDRRDDILTQVVAAIARSLLAASGYHPLPENTPDANYRLALDHMEQHLAQSSIAVRDQQLLALVAVDALGGWHLEPQDDTQEMHVYHSDTDELDPVVVHRLAKALDRSPDQEPLLWQHIQEAAVTAPENTTLILASVRVLLDEIPINVLDDAAGQMVVDSIMGG